MASVYQIPDAGGATLRTQRHDSYPLRTVTRLTGLSQDLIRAWEKRYGVVKPMRGPRGARLYTKDDVEHLRILGLVVASGRAIGDVARLDGHELRELATTKPATERLDRAAKSDAAPPAIVEAMLAAARRFDLPALDRHLGEAFIGLGSARFSRQVAVPLLEQVGRCWKKGELSMGEEHLISALLRGLLVATMRQRGQSRDATVLLATPAGERHEFGLLLTGLSIVEAGFGVYYLGVDLPADELSAATERSHAAVLGLGCVNSSNTRHAAAEIRRIEGRIPEATEIWLGGRQAYAVATRLGHTRARVVGDLDSLEAEIERLRAVSATGR